MEITKKRDRIACYFESQPGGCKKPHCPFQHQNILDHPREEDIKKMPDLILPVKKEIDGGKIEKLLVEAKEPERQVIPPSHSAGCDTPPRPVQPTAKPPNPVIVPLQDGESDSESVSGTPQKRRDPDPRLSAELEWELRRLRQIQEHEANLIGYTFEDDEENQDQMEEEVIAENEEETEEVVEEVVEVEDQGDAVHRRLNSPSSGIHLRLGSRANEEEDLRHSILKHRVEHRNNESRKRHKVPVTERLGGVAGRALAETLGAHVRKPQVKRLASKKEVALSDKTLKTIAQRLGNQTGSTSRRLGPPAKESPKNKNSPAEKQSERPVASRIGMKRGHIFEDKEEFEDSAKESETSRKKQVHKTEPLELDFTIKSLADIRAEKQKKGSIQKVQTTNGTKNGTKKYMSEIKETKLPKKENEFRIMTLAEIKASKKISSANDLGLEKQPKRAISPISFSENSSKKIRSMEASQISSVPSLDKKEGKTILGTRKIAINRSSVKISETVSESASAEKVSESTNATVQLKKSSTNISDNTSSTIHNKNITHVNAKTSTPVPAKKHSVSSEKMLTVSRMDSLLEDEEALLLGGDMLELDDDDEIDEAELLL